MKNHWGGGVHLTPPPRHIQLICTNIQNNKYTNIQSLKTQFNKIRQSGGFLGRLVGPLLKTDLSLLKDVLNLLAKNGLIPFGLTAATSATDPAIQNNIFGSGMTTLIISNKEMNDIMKIAKSREESGLFIKGVSETIKNEAK